MRMNPHLMFNGLAKQNGYITRWRKTKPLPMQKALWSPGFAAVVDPFGTPVGDQHNTVEPHFSRFLPVLLLGDYVHRS